MRGMFPVALYGSEKSNDDGVELPVLANTTRPCAYERAEISTGTYLSERTSCHVYGRLLAGLQSRI